VTGHAVRGGLVYCAVVGVIPAAATAPALIIVGSMMIGPVVNV
jgi:xanthine/uracil/vitamin C permease (AzgA family)